MILLDLPLEILRLVIQQVINCGSSHDLAQVKLFNSESHLPTTSSLASGIFAAYYLQRRALAPDSSEDNIFIRTVHDVSYCIWEIMNDLNPDTDLTESDKHEKLKQTTLDVSRAAAELNLRRLGLALREKDSLEEPFDPDEYDQDWEHLLPVAVNMGNLPLVERLLEEQKYLGLEVCSSIMFRTPLFNAAYKGDLEIAHALLNGGANADIDSELRDGENRGEHGFSGYLMNLQPMGFSEPETALKLRC
ncbi:hypothetical protein SI65_00755 [Aspergillus cristatus]|uniref:Uncharacterized protein n=1 Tax=Aspergillus cristatus TaxID=573508 RepID=A0A1E3BS25_ASPCR|nr:hypothetical protein SI65_00755 [Aspergillus cristatus]